MKLIDQLIAAGECGRKLAEEIRIEAERRQAVKDSWRARNKAAWDVRRSEGRKYTLDKVLEVVPVGIENAIFLADVKAHFADDKHATGVSSAVSFLCRHNRIKHTGKRKRFRYYKEQA